MVIQLVLIFLLKVELWSYSSCDSSCSKRHIVTLTKDGYGSAVLIPMFGGTVRTDVNGNATADGKRCLADAVTVIFFFNLFYRKCADFKQKEYFINIQKQNCF